MGCKIAAPDLEGSVAGSELFVAHTDQEVELFTQKVKTDVDSVLNSVDKNEKGLLVHASTLGALEALLTYLKSQKVPVSFLGIGPVHRKDVLTIVQNAVDKPECAVVLAFDVEIMPEAQKIAAEHKITIFSDLIIYHLTDMYSQYLKDLKLAAKEAARTQIFFPVKLQYLDKQLFHRSKPVIIGVKVLGGTLYKNVPLVTSKTDKILFVGVVEGIEISQKPVEKAVMGDEVAISIQPPKRYFYHC